jgi:hypothetical protein
MYDIIANDEMTRQFFDAKQQRKHIDDAIDAAASSCIEFATMSIDVDDDTIREYEITLRIVRHTSHVVDVLIDDISFRVQLCDDEINNALYATTRD